MHTTSGGSPRSLLSPASSHASRRMAGSPGGRRRRRLPASDRKSSAGSAEAAEGGRQAMRLQERSSSCREGRPGAWDRQGGTCGVGEEGGRELGNVVKAWFGVGMLG